MIKTLQISLKPNQTKKGLILARKITTIAELSVPKIKAVHWYKQTEQQPLMIISPDKVP